MRNVNKGMPGSVGYPDTYVHKVYKTARTFKTEGDLYESITGHRSLPIDEKDAKSGGTKRGN